MEPLATDSLLPVRIVAAIAFVAMICAYVYVLRQLRKIEKIIVADNLVPSELGPRNNMVPMVCLMPLVATALLLYLIVNTKRRCRLSDTSYDGRKSSPRSMAVSALRFSRSRPMLATAASLSSWQ